MVKRKQPEQLTLETREVNGHKIEYRKIKELEEVTIDGKQAPFFRVGRSYNLELDAYSPAQPTLLDAAEAFAKRLPVCNP